MNDFVTNKLAAFVRSHAQVRRFWVALSGGLDSTVLLHSLSQLELDHPLQVLHVNHQLSPNAGVWQAHCRQLADRYDLPIETVSVEVDAKGRGLEKAARDARYQVFERYIEAGDMLLLAHHADDQAETLLLRLLRGAGLRGLGAIPPVRPLGSGLLGRPLLDVTRGEIHRYALDHSLYWVDDESNQSTEFDRNYLRLRVLPALAERWPQVARRFQQSAELLRENERLLAEYTQEDLVRVERRRERLGESLDLNKLLALSNSRRNAVLREWLNEGGCQPPERGHLGAFADLATAAADAKPLVCGPGWEMRRFNKRVYRLPTLPPIEPLRQDWQPEREATLPHGASLTARPAPQGLRADCAYHLRLRTGGERCRPHNRQHSQTLKKLLQEYKLEPWLRDRVPLIYCGESLAAVGDLWICRDFYVEGPRAWALEWRL